MIITMDNVITLVANSNTSTIGIDPFATATSPRSHLLTQLCPILRQTRTAITSSPTSQKNHHLSQRRHATCTLDPGRTEESKVTHPARRSGLEPETPGPKPGQLPITHNADRTLRRCHLVTRDSAGSLARIHKTTKGIRKPKGPDCLNDESPTHKRGASIIHVKRIWIHFTTARPG